MTLTRPVGDPSPETPDSPHGSEVQSKSLVASRGRKRKTPAALAGEKPTGSYGDSLSNVVLNPLIITSLSDAVQF